MYVYMHMMYVWHVHMCVSVCGIYVYVHGVCVFGCISVFKCVWCVCMCICVFKCVWCVYMCVCVCVTESHQRHMSLPPQHGKSQAAP
jgi:hypothetical protein